MQQTLGQLRYYIMPLAHSGDYELLPLVSELERFVNTAETDPEGAAADLRNLLLESQSFYKLAKTKEYLERLTQITKTLNLLKKQLNMETAAVESQFEALSQGPKPTSFYVPVQYNIAGLQSTRIADYLQRLQESIQKPTFQEIARQNAQYLALSQGVGAVSGQVQPYSVSGFYGIYNMYNASSFQGMPGTYNYGYSGFYPSAALDQNYSGPELRGMGASGTTGSRFYYFSGVSRLSSIAYPPKPPTTPAYDLSLLVENVKLMVNQLSLLQHDQQEQLKTNQRLREELADVRRELRNQADEAAKERTDTARKMEALEKRLSGLRTLFRTFAVYSEFKDNLVAQMQHEFDEVRAIFRVGPSAGTAFAGDRGSSDWSGNAKADGTGRKKTSKADELSDELQAQRTALRAGFDALGSTGAAEEAPDELARQMGQIREMEERIAAQQRQLAAMRGELDGAGLTGDAGSRRESVGGAPVSSAAALGALGPAGTTGESPDVQLSGLQRPDILGESFAVDGAGLGE